MRLVHNYVDKGATRHFLVQAGSCEIHIARNKVAVFDHDLRHHVLGSTTLVGRDQVLVPVVLPDRVLQVIEVFTTRIGLIPHHQPGPLAVAHRRCTGIGQQVDVDVSAAQQECVVTRLPNGKLAFLGRGHAQKFNHLDFVGLGPAVSGFVFHELFLPSYTC